MATISALVAVVGFVYFVLTPRIFDWFTIAYASACVYMLPAFLGYARHAGDEVSLETETYLICLTILSAIIAGAACSDWMSRSIRSPVPNDSAPRNAERDFATVLAPLAFIGMALTAIGAGDALLAAGKQEMLDSLPAWSLLWNMASITGFVFAFSSGQRKLLAGQSLSLLMLWYLGFRSPAALAALGACVLWVSQRGPRAIIGNWKLAASAIGFATVVFSYKRIYALVKLGHWDKAAEAVNSDGFLSATILNSEAMSQFHIVNSVVAANYRVPFWMHWKETLVNIALPSGSQGYDPSFGGWVAIDLYPDANFGIASSIWAEMYSTGGWLLLFFFVAIYVLALHLASVANRTRISPSTVFLCAWMPYWAFYIHRNDAHRMLSFAKQHVLLVMICGTAVLLLRVVRDHIAPTHPQAHERINISLD